MMRKFANYFLFVIMARKGSPLMIISNDPPPVCRNLVIEYLIVNLAHCFILMDLLPPLCSLFNVMDLFITGLIFQSSLNVKTLPAESHFVNGPNDRCL